MLPLGSTVRISNSKYHTQELIHASPTFTIVRADNLILGRSEALKVSHTKNPQLFHDAEKIARLSHPSNIQLLNTGFVDLGEERAVIALSMRSGMTSQEVLDTSGPMSPLRCCRLLAQILGALDEVHNLGLVYGSLSAQTLRICDRIVEQCCIADYGLSAPVRENHQTNPTHLLSTDPDYTAPERFLGAVASPRGDLFSVGVIFYELLTGKRPFPYTGFGLLQAYQRGEEPTPMSEHAEVPQPLEQFILQMMSVDVERRIPSARAAAARLMELDPDELQAYSSNPLMDRNALSTDLHVHAPPPSINSTPEIWVLNEDPAFRLPNAQELVELLKQKYRVRTLSQNSLTAAHTLLKQGQLPPPWVVLFGDLHVILGEPLLGILSKRGDLSRVLVSTHLNADMMHTTVNACSLDQQLLADGSPEMLLASVEEMVTRTRNILVTRSRAESMLHDAQSTIFSLKQRLASAKRGPARQSRRSR